MFDYENINNKEICEKLIDAEVLSKEQLQKAVDYQLKFGMSLVEVLVDFNFVSKESLKNIVEDDRRVDLSELEIKESVIYCIPGEIAKKYKVMPYDESNGVLYIAISDPSNIFALDDLRFITGKNIKTVEMDKTIIEKTIEKYYALGTKESGKALEELQEEYNIDVVEENVENEEVIESAPAVRLANSILVEAIKMKASDIHVEPFENDVLVRYRVDGGLKEIMTLPKNIYSAVSTRIKIIARMDIAEKRIPQDGRIEMKIDDKPYDFRVSSLPTVFGEKIVIRILDRGSILITRDKLGFTDSENEIITDMLGMPHGILVVTGPTGSGKTTTLYTFLQEMNTPEKNITTIEDPVEYMLDRINQVNVNTKAGMTFASGLKSLLRQDPDVIMLGEIRDEETAQIALRASITGHFVLSTLHTNDAPSTITRLLDMGLKSYLVADAVVGVIAQRLIRKLCPFCKEKYEPSKSERELLGDTKVQKIYKSRGCNRCNDIGYKGRCAVHEVMMINTELKALIESGTTIEELKEAAIKNGMVTILDNCRELVLKGETSINELGRIVYAKE